MIQTCVKVRPTSCNFQGLPTSLFPPSHHQTIHSCQYVSMFFLFNLQSQLPVTPQSPAGQGTNAAATARRSHQPFLDQ